ADPVRLAAAGALVGIVAFSMVVFAQPLDAMGLLVTGVALIGLGGGLFSVGTLSAAMGFDSGGLHGMVLGAWGGVVATAAGVSVALGGMLRDLVSSLAQAGVLGEALSTPAAGYGAVYHLEIALLFVTLAVVGPLVRPRRARPGAGADATARFGLAEFPR
ncbi:MAG: PucC family protein, partial [Gemmatimonas sp.]